MSRLAAPSIEKKEDLPSFVVANNKETDDMVTVHTEEVEAQNSEDKTQTKNWPLEETEENITITKGNDLDLDKDLIREGLSLFDNFA